MKVRGLFILLTIVFLASLASAAPEMPHRVFGEVTEDGSDLAYAEIYFIYNGETIASTETDSSGYYDFKISYSEDYSEQDLTIKVNNQETEKKVTFSSGNSERIDISASFSETEDEQDDQGSRPSMGGGGGFPTPEENETVENNETENNQTETTEPQENETNDETETQPDENINQTENQNDTVENDESVNRFTGLATLEPSNIGKIITDALSRLSRLIASFF